VITDGDTIPSYKFHCPLTSLPIIFNKPILSDVPYLPADAGLVEKWRSRLPSCFKIGICWSGSKGNEYNQHRNFPLSSFAPLANIPGVQLVSLQHGYGAEQIQLNEFPVVDLGPESKPFEDAATIMANLDLIISADTAPAHLAGALARPVWVPLPTQHDWRWIVGRDDSPWYPTMRLFRQSVAGEWGDVFQRMALALRGNRGCLTG